MDDSSPPPIAAVCLYALAVAVAVTRLLQPSKQRGNLGHSIPWAPGAIPLLGHALAYRHDPAHFLLDAREKAGDIFQLNLAGKRMIVVCGPTAQRRVANAPESMLSARRAVADVGFEEMLGQGNVHEGTDLHKGIVKGMWHAKGSERVVRGFIEAARMALREELSSLQRTQQQRVEFMALMRRVVLRAVIERFIGPFFLGGWKEFDFVVEFMVFQDDLEEATAKSAVMPRWLALPLFLWPLKRRREKLERIITKRLKDALPNTTEKDVGFWLTAVRDDRSMEEVAHFIVGLLFAAHKNPAIGAAQSYLMLRERGTPKQQQQCRTEAEGLLSNPHLEQLKEKCPMLNRLCLEALRLTAHSIGGLRTACQDFPLENGGVIPAGATIALAHIPASLDAITWKDPHTLDLNMESSTRSKHLHDDEYAFTTFSHGVHQCPGRRFSTMLLPCTVALLLAEYDIELPATVPPLSFERATLAQRAGPVYVVLTEKSRRD